MASNLHSMGTVLSQAREEHDHSDDPTILGGAWLSSDPGPTTVRYGGNTACVSVELGHDTLLVLDAGTGIRPLGEHLATKDTDIFVLLSHAHWDHIQGFPFFAPLYQPHRLISLVPTRVGPSLWRLTLASMDAVD